MFCFLTVLLTIDIPVLFLLYEMELRPHCEPENPENIVLIAEF